MQYGVISVLNFRHCLHNERIHQFLICHQILQRLGLAGHRNWLTVKVDLIFDTTLEALLFTCLLALLSLSHRLSLARYTHRLNQEPVASPAIQKIVSD